MVKNVSLPNFVVNHPGLSAKMVLITAMLAIAILSGTAAAIGDPNL